MTNTPHEVNVAGGQVGGIGDGWHVEGGIHLHATPPPANPTERRNREAMLQLVRNTWIEGVLEQSIHGAAMLDLGKDYTPDAVERPWDMELHMPGQARRPVPHGTPILEVFDRCSSALLILGEPGSGKTTTLLELARAAIDRAEQDEIRHIPVVFNLSSWAVKQAPLEDWLLEELNTKYLIPKRIARPWIEDDHLLLLLDGLDEVKAEARETCVAAINAYREEHLVPLVVCSRTADYAGLTTRLHLQGAIGLRPLTPAQIEAYLAGAGAELRAVRATLKHDHVLQEMAQSPLMLSVMTLAYRGLEVEELQTLATPEARRQHLFDAYVERMFQRRTKDTPYTPEQTRHWLVYLAGQLREHKQTVFYIENLQPDWLPEHKGKRARRLARLVFGLGGGLGVGLVFGLGDGLVGGLVFGLGGELVFGLGGELVFGLVDEGGGAVLLHYALRIILARTDRLPWRLVPFLDHCVDRIFLRRVGGGYIFVHRLLMEHFAAMETTE
jgi:DNA polymerase III delta prime subunit